MIFSISFKCQYFQELQILSKNPNFQLFIRPLLIFLIAKFTSYPLPNAMNCKIIDAKQQKTTFQAKKWIQLNKIRATLGRDTSFVKKLLTFYKLIQENRRVRMYGGYYPIYKPDYNTHNFKFNANQGNFTPYMIPKENQLQVKIQEPQPYLRESYPFLITPSIKVEEKDRQELYQEHQMFDQNNEEVKKIKQHIRTSSRYDITKELIKKFQRKEGMSNLNRIILPHYRTYEYMLCYLKIIASQPQQIRSKFIEFINSNVVNTINEKTSRLKKYTEQKKQIYFFFLLQSMKRIIESAELFFLNQDKEESFRKLYKIGETNNYVSRKNFKIRKNDKILCPTVSVPHSVSPVISESIPAVKIEAPIPIQMQKPMKIQQQILCPIKMEEPFMKAQGTTPKEENTHFYQ